MSHYLIYGSYLVLSVLMLVAQFFPDTLMYQRNLITQGQGWRLISSSFTHTGWVHYVMNLVGLWLWVSLQRSPIPAWRFLTLTVILSVSISSLFWLFHPHLEWYVGFSGVLYSLYMAWALYLVSSTERLLGIILVAGLVGKTLWDIQLPDSLSSQLIQAPVIYQAHLYGMLLAPLSAIWLYRRDKPI